VKEVSSRYVKSIGK